MFIELRSRHEEGELLAARSAHRAAGRPSITAATTSAAPHPTSAPHFTSAVTTCRSSNTASRRGSSMVHDASQNGRLIWYLIGGSGQIVKDEMAECVLAKRSRCSDINILHGIPELQFRLKCNNGVGGRVLQPWLACRGARAVPEVN
jgi:hypothetical protein